MDALARYRQGNVQASYNDALFAGTSQELITRPYAAYFDALLAEDQLRLAHAQSNPLIENLAGNERLLAKDAGTKTDVLESRARNELAQAQVIEARDIITNTRNALEIIIGIDPGALDTMRTEVNIMPLTPAGLAEWESIARAIYDHPKFVLLDEPNSSLDAAGEQALMNALLALKARKCSTIVISHRTNILPAADKILLLREGQVAAFGPRDEILEKLRQASAPRVVPAAGDSARQAAGGAA